MYLVLDRLVDVVNQGNVETKTKHQKFAPFRHLKEGGVHVSVQDQVLEGLRARCVCGEHRYSSSILHYSGDIALPLVREIKKQQGFPQGVHPFDVYTESKELSTIKRNQVHHKTCPHLQFWRHPSATGA